MTSLVLFLETGDGSRPDADSLVEVVRGERATVVALQVPIVEGDSLASDPFTRCYHQHGVDLAAVDPAFSLRDVVVCKTPAPDSGLNAVLLHLWNWPESTYDVDAVRVPYEGYRDPRNNPAGKNPGNVWAFSVPHNDRGPGTRTDRTRETDAIENTLAGGHLETEAVERLITCHTETGDRVHAWANRRDRAVVERIATDLDREFAVVPTGAGHEPREIPVGVADYAVEGRLEGEQTDEEHSRSGIRVRRYSFADVPVSDGVDSDRSGRETVHDSGVVDSATSTEEIRRGDTLEISDAEAVYAICDCRVGISKLPEGTVHDVVTSPPYNIAYDPFNVPKPDPSTGQLRAPLRRGYDDERPPERYHDLLASTFEVLDPKLSADSADVFVNLKNNYADGDCRPPFWLLELVPSNWRFSDLLIWRYDISYDPARNKYKPYYEWVFRFSTGRVNRPPDHRFLQDYYVPIVKGNSREREGLIHPAIFPKELVHRCLEVSGHDGLVLDPFAGSGTTLAAAVERGRPTVGFETEPSYAPDFETRFERASMPTE